MKKAYRFLIFLGGLTLHFLTGQVLYNVNGYVFLEDQMDGGSHENVKIKFYNLPSMTTEDSTLSQTDGYYSINVSPGYYLVEWTKDNYVPWELGGLALAGNTTLDTVILIPGQVLEVSDTVSGHWTTGYVYFVMDDIIVPSGDTLTIDAGVRVKFASGKGMTVNGTLLANGSESAHIKFTSKEPTPLPGDWTNLNLNGPNNYLSYVDYEYASDGIVANNASNTTIDHVSMNGNLSLTARGLYFTGSTDLTLTNNIIAVGGSYGIYANNSLNSVISNNTISANSYGISASNSDNTIFSANIISNAQSYGIYAPYSSNGQFTQNLINSSPTVGICANQSDNAHFLNNTITTSNNGIEAQDATGGGVTINGNNITGFKDFGIYFNNSPNSTITNNIVISQTSPDYDMRGIQGHSPNSLVSNNQVTIDYPDYNTWDTRYHYGIDCNQSTISNNTVYVEGGYYNYSTNYSEIGFGIHSDNSIISNNMIDVNMNYNTGSNYFMYGIGSSGTSTITNNTIRRLKWKVRAIYTDGQATISGNKIINAGSVSSGEEDAYAIYTGTNTIVRNDSIIGMPYGIHIQDDSGINIDSNYIDVTYHGVYIYNSSAYVTQNLIKSLYGRGIHCENQSGNEFSNNTIIGGGDFGIYITNLSNPTVINNIISGFQNGIYAENSIQNYNLDHNDFWDITGSLFSGSAIPPLAGQIIDENDNGDPSDIYGNLNLDPQFVAPDTGNYHIEGSSPCVNAGNSNYTDLDGTIADIGAFYYHIFVVINHTSLSATNDTLGPYPVSAEIYSPAGNTIAATLHYSTDGVNYSAVTMNETANDTFTANIPGQSLNTTISYYLEATDGTHTVTDPYNIDNNVYSFYVTLFDQFANLSGSSNQDGSITLQWTTPVPISGTLIGLKLYRDNEPNMTLTPDHLYQSFAGDSLTYTDTNVEEAITYYYRLTGIVVEGTDTTESIVSSEVAVTSDNPTLVRVQGAAYLQDTTNHSGILVYFEKVSPAAVEDSLLTDSTGAIDIVMQVGIYNIHFTKDGYQPVLDGNRFLSANTTLDTVTLIPGGTMSLSGDISGTLLHSNLHFIDGDITVPSGDTLIIEPGTVLKFRGDYSFTVNGTIFAIGTVDSHIVFTSGTPSPLEGDWQRITLNNAPNSVFRYCEFYYAENGLLLNESDNTEISHSTFDRFLLNAEGVSDGDYNNNDSLIITYNQFRNGFQKAVNLNNAYGSEISHNDILVTDVGIFCNDCDGSDFSYNTIYPGVDGYLRIGIQAEYSNNSTFNYNTINGYYDYGIYFYSASNSVVAYNTISDTNLQGSYETGSDKWGIRNPNSYQNCLIKGNEIINHAYYNNYGVENYDGEIDSNTIYLYTWSCGLARGIRSDRSKITSNNVFVDDDNDCNISIGIEAYGDNNHFSTVSNNIVYSKRESRGFTGNYAILRDNQFYGYVENSYNYEWAITGGPSLVVENNKFYDYQLGISINGQDSRVRDNYFSVHGGTGFSISGGNNTVIQRNVIVMDGGNTYGIHLANGNASDLFRNTIVSSNADHTGTGIRAEGNSHPVVNSNLIYGFGTGIDAASDIYTLKFNLIYDVSSFFSGSGLPSQTGQVVTVNNNGDPSDIYSNIFLNPLFNPPVNDTFQVSLQVGSPAIDAGDVDSLDLDGTIADIGAWFFNVGYVPQQVHVDSTGDGYVAISWDIIATDSLVSFKPYYKLHSASDWTSPGNTTSQHYVFTGLLNNTTYDFAATAVYTNTESNFSRVINEQAGVAIVVITPPHLIHETTNSDTTNYLLTFSNNGTKMLTYAVATDSLGSSLLSEDMFVSLFGSVTPGSSDTSKFAIPPMGSGVFVSYAPYVTNDPDHLYLAVPLLHLVDYTFVPPVQFSPGSQTGDPFYLVVDNADIDGDPLQPGDELALFDGDSCVGAGMFDGNLPFVVRAYGFTEGNSYTVKAWDNSQYRYATAQVETYTVGQGSFVANGFNEIDLTATVYVTNQITLIPNQFNLVSLNHYPQNPDASAVFGDIAGLEIVYDDEGGAFIPDYDINTIGSVDITEGYYLFFDSTGVDLTYTGLPISVSDWPLLLQAQRWNYFSYLKDQPADVSVLFASITDSIDIIQSDDGGAWIPSMGINTLGNLTPGKGYTTFLTANTDQTFIYPATQGTLARLLAEGPTPQHFVFERTGLPYAVVVQEALFEGRPLEESDEIGIFNGERCVGAGVFTSIEPLVITAWQGDEKLDLPGFVEGNPIAFRVFSQKYSKEYPLKATFRQETESYFKNTPYTVVKRVNTNGGIIPDVYALGHNYPNPFNPLTRIPYQLPEDTRVRIAVYNLLGQEVVTLVNDFQLAAYHTAVWDGRDKFGREVPSGVYIYRMETPRFHKTQKLVLLK